MSSPGFSVIDVRNRQAHIVAVSHRKTNSKQSHGGRLEDIRDELSSLYAKYKPFDVVIREKGFSRFAVETQVLYKVHGVAEWYLRGHKMEEIPPSTVKKVLTGSGKASKDDVANAVKRYIGDYEFKTDDESDSVGVVLAWLLQNKLIDEVS
jgi:crossover junction endodeoxyribonuclease RuvC